MRGFREQGLVAFLLILAGSAAACGGGSEGGTGGAGGSGPGGSGGGANGCQAPTQDPATYDFPGTFTPSTTDHGTAASCGYSGEATVGPMAYDGFEDLIVKDFMSDEIVCQVRFALKYAGCAPAGCVGPRGAACDMTWLLQYSNPQKMKDKNGACANSSYQLDDAHIAKITGKQVAYGYVAQSNCDAHGDCRVIYSTVEKRWMGKTLSEVASNAALQSTKLTYTQTASCSFKAM